MTVPSVAVATMNFMFGMCNCSVDSDAGTGDFSLVLWILHVCGRVHMQSHVSLSMGSGIHKSVPFCLFVLCCLIF